jgi:hypothetical protein
LDGRFGESFCHTEWMMSVNWRSFQVAVMLMMLVANGASAQDSFRRVATFPVFLNETIETQTVASSIAADTSGRWVVYTDAVQGKLGFVDIADPAKPLPAGTLDLGGSPVTVAAAGPFALVAVATSDAQGELLIVRISTRAIVRTIPLSGPPTDVAVDPQGNYAAVSIGATGEVLILDLVTPFPNLWPKRTAWLAGETNDPFPQGLALSEQGRCAVALTSENQVVVLNLNHLKGLRLLAALIAPGTLNGAQVEHSWSAETATVPQVDLVPNRLIELDATLLDQPRGPIAVDWTGPNTLATANQWSRGFSLFNRQGNLQFDAVNRLEHLTARIGHYPEHRAGVLGIEPNAVMVSRFKNTNYMFVSAKTAGMVAIYRQKGNAAPVYQQVVPTPKSPKGLLSIPKRNLFLASSDEDNRVGKFRSAISIYQLQNGPANYPTLVSANRPNGTPIPWAGVSGLGADPLNPNVMYAVGDNRYRRSSILKIDLAQQVPTITQEISLINNGAMPGLPLGSIDIDPEGVAVRANGGFWVASEGNTPPDSPGIINDLLLQVAPNGVVEKEIILPASLRANPFRFGFEGVTCIVDSDGKEMVYVCLQRKWPDDPVGFCKIAKYDVTNEAWTFALYPLDAPTSPYPGTNWVGLSEITAIDEHTLLILERDNQAGPDARIKRLYVVDISADDFKSHGEALTKLTKTLKRDILLDLAAPNGFVLEKVEGVAVLPNGDTYIAVDNDGSTVFGETQLINIGPIFP